MKTNHGDLFIYSMWGNFMEMSLNKVFELFSRVVTLYKAFNFKEVPYLSNVVYGSSIYRIVGLHNEDTTINLTLTNKTDYFEGLNYYVTYLELKADKYVNCVKQSSTIFNRFYSIDSNYYTTSLDRLKEIRKIALDRYLHFCDHRYTFRRLNLNKFSSKLISYITALIKSHSTMKHRSSDFTIKDVYFTYNGLNRTLVIVFKHIDNIATEAIYINPKEL